MRRIGDTWNGSVGDRRIMLAAGVAAACGVALSCGGKTGGYGGHDGAGSDSSGAGGAGAGDADAESGGAPLGTGGALSQGISWNDPATDAGVLSGSGGIQGLLGASGGGGESGAGSSCNYGLLWEAVTYDVDAAGQCSPLICEDHEGRRSFGIVVDDEGRLVDNTFIWREAEKAAWLAQFENVRFSCIAGQTIEYCCVGSP